MSHGQPQKENFKWSEENQALADPFAPRKVPSYEYRMPESSPSADESEMEVCYQQHGRAASDNLYKNEDTYDTRYYGGGDPVAEHKSTSVSRTYSQRRSRSSDTAGTSGMTSSKHDAKRIKLDHHGMEDGGSGREDGGSGRGDGVKEEQFGGTYRPSRKDGSCPRYQPRKSTPTSSTSIIIPTFDATADSDIVPPLGTADLRPGYLPIHRSVIDDTKRQIAELKCNIRLMTSPNMGTPSFNNRQEYEWCVKVLKFLEANLSHAEKTNTHLGRR